MTTSEPDRGLGGAVRAARKARGWTQTDLAERSGVSRPTIARIETGSFVSTGTLAKIAAALDLAVGLEDQDQPRRE